MLPLSMVRMTKPACLLPYQAGVQQLLSIYQNVLADDFTIAENLFENTAACIPYLWLLVSECNTVYGIASLTDVIPGRHSFIHGAYHPSIRKHPQVKTIIDAVLHEAFYTLGVQKLKAEFDADNVGAKGFCHRFGFIQEARLRADTQRQGKKQDVLIYTLLKEKKSCH